MTKICPLCRKEGFLLRQMAPADLQKLYSNYSKIPLSKSLAQKYLTETVSENECKDCLLRWYTPGKLGESDFYEHLSSSPGYYNPNSWDKRTALQFLSLLGKGTAVDVGCGDGWLIREGIRLGWTMFGTDLNTASVNQGQADGLDIFLPTDQKISGRNTTVLLSLQTLEHVDNPVQWIKDQIGIFKPKYLVLAVPACDTMLGYTNDPLVWPPHHRTLWSGSSLRKLAEIIKFNVVTIKYEENTWHRFNSLLDREDSRKLWKKPYIPAGVLGRLAFIALRACRIPWVSRAHSVIALLKSTDL